MSEHDYVEPPDDEEYAFTVTDGVLQPAAGSASGPADNAEKVTARRDGDRLLVFSPFRLKDAIKELPGRRWDKARKCWTLPATPAGAASADRVARMSGCTFDWDEGTAALLDAHARQRAAAAYKSAADGTLAAPPFPDGAAAHRHHQLQAFNFANPSLTDNDSGDLEAVGLFMDMGTMKSRVVVDTVAHRGARRVLVVCPRNVLGVWPREFRRWSPAPLEVLAPRKGTIRRRAGEIEDRLNASDAQVDHTLVVVVNYESAWREPMADLLLSREWDLVVLDESHRIKAPGGRASMFCARLREHARARFCLTGTPMPHSPLDVYAQYRFLEPGIFGTSFTAFRHRYAVMGGYGGHEVLRYQREDELAERMYEIAFRVMADDVLDLPEPVWSTRTTQLTPKALEAYAALESDLVADVEEGKVTAANALVRLLRLQQVTSGWLPLDDPDAAGETTWVEVDTAKRDLLADTLEEVALREPVVVCCRFTRDLDNVATVCEKQGRRYGELSGRRKDGLTDDAEMAPDIDVLGVQIQSGGVGIDLVRSAYCILYSVGYSLGDFEQLLKRTHRPGQERQVRYVQLCCEDTKDEDVFDALRARKSLVEYILGLAS